MIIHDRDDWNESELLIGDSYATTCDRVIAHSLSDLGTLDVELPSEKRATIEIVALLHRAAVLAQEQLGYSADDFSIAALHVFMRRAS
jgi:hypothetical protein